MPAAHDIPLLILRAISALGALALFYLALFMYKDEADRWQNRLVDLWVEIGSGSQGFLSAQAALVKVSSGIVSSWLTWLLGKRLVSIQVVAVSFSLSIASSVFVALTGLIFSIRRGRAVGTAWQIELALGVGFLLFGLYGVRWLCGRRKPLLALAIPVTVVGMVVVFELYTSPSQIDKKVGFASLALAGVLLFSAPVVGVFCDLLVLVVNRLVLRSMATTGRVIVLLLGLLYNLAWVAFLADSTIFLLREAFGWQSWAGDPMDAFLRLPVFQSQYGILASLIFVLGLASNLFTLCASVCLSTIVAAALSHRVFWPVAERSVYALYQWNVFTNKPLQISAGLALIVFAFPGLRDILKLFRP